ncbi:MAG TPA: adenosylcobinamide-GDP ribazoletransferase, partial [Candidatus Dormibacteraeota bacterium]|nr:adenosylcobinamide-GDP ribazoletransferase [Candidatus Dormibacteraeota bacterium]
MSIRSLRAAASFLTILPVANADGSPGERLGRVYFPAIGAVVGLAAAAVFTIMSALGPPLLAAAVTVGAVCLVTGAIHLDGLADAFDGLLGRGDAARRLE